MLNDTGYAGPLRQHDELCIDAYKIGNRPICLETSRSRSGNRLSVRRVQDFKRIAVARARSSTLKHPLATATGGANSNTAEEQHAFGMTTGGDSSEAVYYSDGE